MYIYLFNCPSDPECWVRVLNIFFDKHYKCNYLGPYMFGHSIEAAPTYIVQSQ